MIFFKREKVHENKTQTYTFVTVFLKLMTFDMFDKKRWLNSTLK